MYRLWEKKTFQYKNSLGKKDIPHFFGIWEKNTIHLGKKDISKKASGKKRLCIFLLASGKKGFSSGKKIKPSFNVKKELYIVLHAQTYI